MVSKRLSKATKFSMLLLWLSLALSTWCYYIWNNNTYMTYTDVPVTFFDRHMGQSCHKSSCRDAPEGWFRTDDGFVFSQPISDYMYYRMHLGEHFTLSMRPFDLHQTPRENIYWFFGPIIVLMATCIIWFLTLIQLADQYRNRKG